MPRCTSPLLLSVLLLSVLGATGRASAEGPESHTFTAKGVKIHYLTQGTGDAVVLIHGLHSGAKGNWQLPGTMAALAARHHVVALDMPGHGDSDRPDDAAAYGVQMAEDVILLMDHLKIKKAHIVGYSMGGFIALRVISDHPDRVISGTLAGSGWIREGSGLQKVWEHLGQGERGTAPAVCVSSIGKLAIDEAAVQKIKVPMTMIVGDRDPVKRLYADPLHNMRKDWPIVEIEGAGHLTCVVKREFSDELVKWIDKQGQR